jgi:hypothetical protein
MIKVRETVPGAGEKIVKVKIISSSRDTLDDLALRRVHPTYLWTAEHDRIFAIDCHAP